MDSFILDTSSGTRLHCYQWLPETTPTAAITIAHGMGEHARRYDWVAGELNKAGYAVYAADHRGHGATSIDHDPGGLGDMGEDGWNRTIADVHDLVAAVAAKHPDLPQVLFGHSMGSMITQQYLYRYPQGLDAAVISGSPGFASPFQLWLSHLIARFESWRHGPAGESALLDKMIFGNANASFEHAAATGFEWLSRDPQQVQQYVDDPLCGFVLRAGSLANMFAGAREARRAASLQQLPATLPVYIFSGADDPVHNESKGLNSLLQAYRQRFKQVDFTLYPGGRHEMLNETNRQQVVDDLTGWLARTLNR
jgi:alpha-beta hydrolase superfamily lysophospholipase